MTTSVAIDHRGSIDEQYFTGAASTLRNTRSVTKTITGMLVGIAIERGELGGVAARVGEFLDVPRDKTTLTIEQLLTMTSLLDCDDSDEASPGNEERMYPLDDWIGFTLGLPVRESRSFSYCTAGVTLLSAVLEAATGEAVPDYARRVLFEPLGIAEARWPFSALGVAQTGGGLELRTLDLLALGALYRDGGRGIVSRDWVEQSVLPHVRVDGTHSYGYLWWLRSHDGVASYAMSGAGGNRVAVFPELGAVVVVTAERFGQRDAHDRTDALLSELIGGLR